MSVYYSRFSLNTYSGSPYFQAHVPADYPLELVLQKCRSHRRLPHNLRALAALAGEWEDRVRPAVAGFDDAAGWYDEDGYELDPATGKRLTDDEIDAMWGDDPSLDEIDVEDIPVPDGGFADPATWMEPVPAADSRDDPDAPTEGSLLRDIRSHGREYVAGEYGVPVGADDAELARAILNKLSGASPPSP